MIFLLKHGLFLHYFDHGVDAEHIDAELEQLEVSITHPLEQDLLILIFPLDGYNHWLGLAGDSGGLLLQLLFSLSLRGLLLLQGQQLCCLLLLPLALLPLLLLLELLCDLLGLGLVPLVLPLELLLLQLAETLLLLLGEQFLFARGLGRWWLREGLEALLSSLLDLGAPVDVQAAVDHLAELLDLLQGLLVLLLHLSHDLQGPVLLAEDAVVPLSVDAFDLEEVVGPPGTLNMEGYHAAWMLALNAGATSLAANDALKIESLHIDLAHPHRRLRSHARPGDPHRTAQVDPLVQSLSGHRLWAFEALLVPLQEESIVLGYLSD